MRDGNQDRHKKRHDRHTAADKLRQACSVLTCLLMMSAVAISRDGINVTSSAAQDAGEESVPTGYAGPTPVTLTVEDGIIVSVRADKNNETPEFFSAVETLLLPQWEGMTVDEALTADIDVVSGATMSSEAVIKTVRMELRRYDNAQAGADADAPFGSLRSSLKTVCAMAVILMACIVPLFVRSRRYRTVQLILNVVVLGLWSGTFLSYSLMVNTLSNMIDGGITTGGITLIMTLLLVIPAFIYPLFGRKRHYCSYVCPMGSLQELAGKCVRRKQSVNPRLMRRLNMLREVLWAVLMLLMWSGVWFDWMNYELFVAFIFSQASPVLIAVAVMFVILSCFVPRPYCHFVCPTGTLMKRAETVK